MSLIAYLSSNGALSYKGLAARILARSARSNSPVAKPVASVSTARMLEAS
jgi:hypothetical protein